MACSKSFDGRKAPFVSQRVNDVLRNTNVYLHFVELKRKYLIKEAAGCKRVAKLKVRGIPEKLKVYIRQRMLSALVSFL